MKTITHDSISWKAVSCLVVSSIMAPILFFEARFLFENGFSSHLSQSIRLAALVLGIAYLFATGLRNFRREFSISWDEEGFELKEKGRKRMFKWREVSSIQGDLREFHITSGYNQISVRKSDLNAELLAFMDSKTR